MRNRSWLILGVLALVNAYIFLWRPEGSFSDLRAPVASIRAAQQSGLGVAPENACTDDPVRIFAGLNGLVRLDSKLKEGRSLRLALLEMGIAGDEVENIEASFRGAIDLGLLKGSGAPLRIAIDRDHRLRAIEVELAEGHLVQGCRKDSPDVVGGKFELRTIQHPVSTPMAVVALEVPRNGDLQRAVLEAEEQPELLDLVAQVLAPRVDLMSEIRPEDRIQILVEKRYLGRRFHRYGAVLAVRYLGAAGRVAFYRYEVPGQSPNWYDGHGQLAEVDLLRSPVAWHPYDPDSRGQLAPQIEFVDGRMGAIYRRPEGAPVISLGEGTVESLAKHGSDGLRLVLRMKDKRRLAYANLRGVVAGLKVGDQVKQGQVVAWVGRSGKTPFPRLRFELWSETGELLDPLVIEDRESRRSKNTKPDIPEKHMERFKKDIGSWRRALRKVAG